MQLYVYETIKKNNRKHFLPVKTCYKKGERQQRRNYSMRKVIIGIDEHGAPYVVAKPKKVDVVFRETKNKTFKKWIRTVWYQIKRKLGVI